MEVHAVTPITQTLRQTLSELIASGAQALDTIDRQNDGELLVTLDKMQGH
jgi:hypothetical protein